LVIITLINLTYETSIYYLDDIVFSLFLCKNACFRESYIGKSPALCFVENFSGNLRVEIDVKGWTNVEGYLLVTFHNKTKPVIYTNTINNGFETVFLNFSDVPA